MDKQLWVKMFGKIRLVKSNGLTEASYNIQLETTLQKHIQFYFLYECL